MPHSFIIQFYDVYDGNSAQLNYAYDLVMNDVITTADFQ